VPAGSSTRVHIVMCAIVAHVGFAVDQSCGSVHVCVVVLVQLWLRLSGAIEADSVTESRMQGAEMQLVRIVEDEAKHKWQWEDKSAGRSGNGTEIPDKLSALRCHIVQSATIDMRSMWWKTRCVLWSTSMAWVTRRSCLGYHATSWNVVGMRHQE
jgi:hypothetical protein